MEREYGYELARVFGTRMKRVYELEESALPKPIAQWLERLHHAEQELARRSQCNNGSEDTSPDRA